MTKTKYSIQYKQKYIYFPISNLLAITYLHMTPSEKINHYFVIPSFGYICMYSFIHKNNF